MVIPILFIGSITVLLNGFPVQIYQDFLDSFLGGALRSLIITLQYTTLGILALYITIALNISYMKQNGGGNRPVFEFGSLMGCITGFFIIVGFFSGDPDFSLLSGQGVFSALLAGIIGSALFLRYERIFVNRKTVFIDGADSEFNTALLVILPFLCVALTFAVCNYLITVFFQVQSLQHLFMKAVDMIFIKMHRSYFSGILFTLLLSIMWWFGIHGNNVLNQVAEDLFAAIIPGEIVSKSFIDTFVNMGGTGCLMGLLLALMIFGKRKPTKKLCGMALVPGVFNIGEMLVFGMPVIYNPVMLIPFILAPLLCFSNAYFLTLVGFIPPVSRDVVWTTPALMSGYIATGSAKAVAVQLMNILISGACYAPFVILNEKKSSRVFSTEMDRLVETMKAGKENGQEVVLTELEGDMGRLAKHLAADLEVSISEGRRFSSQFGMENPLLIKYQPQLDDEGKCIGAGAVFEWDHKLFGSIYPPLVIKIAGESGILYSLETYIIEKSIRDSEKFRRYFGEKFILRIYVTATTFFDRRFTEFAQAMADRYTLKTGNICLDITEETQLDMAEENVDQLAAIRMFGYTFARDDSDREGALPMELTAVDCDTLMSMAEK